MNTRYGIWVGDFIREVPLEEIAQMITTSDLKKAWYVEKETRKMIISFFAEVDRRILDDGTHLIKRAITTVLYTKVKEYRSTILYNHPMVRAEYTNETGKPGYQPIPVIRCPDEVVEAVVEAIIKKEGKD